MPVEPLLARLAASRPRVAAEAARPHAEERLLLEVLAGLADTGGLGALGSALQLLGAVEDVVLWGGNVESGAEDLPLAAALREVAPGAGRAVVLEGEPDLVVVTSECVAVVDATVGRPGHAAARAGRGEPVGPAVLDGTAAVLARHGVALSGPDLARHIAAARAAAVALTLAEVAERAAVVIALGAPTSDLLHPGRNPLAGWSWSAGVLHAKSGLTMRTTTWLDVARGLEEAGAAGAVVRAIRAHPVLAATRGDHSRT